MGDMADFALDMISSEDERQMQVLGTSNVFQKTVTHCVLCKAKLVSRIGRYGHFLACPNWPQCKGTTYSGPYPLNEAESDLLG